jgi:hypothetical protein
MYPNSASAQARTASASGRAVKFDHAEANPDLTGSIPCLEASEPRAATARRGHFIDRGLELFDKGYKPVILPKGTKGPVDDEWQITAPRRTRDDIQAMVRQASPSSGVGIFALNAQLLDADIYNVEVAQAVAQLAEERLGPAPTRIGQAPKFGRPYRALDFVGSKYTPHFRLPGDPEGKHLHRVEFIGGNRQWVAFHRHPETGQDYRWDGDLPPRGELTGVTEQQIIDFLDEVELMLAEEFEAEFKGRASVEIEAGSGANTDKLGTPEAVEAALAFIPNDGDGQSYDDWVRIGLAVKAAVENQALAFKLWDAWSRQSAKYGVKATTTKTWRSLKPRGDESGVGAGTIYMLAEAHGWRPPCDLILNGNVAKAVETNPAAALVDRVQKAAQEPKKSREPAGGTEQQAEARSAPVSPGAARTSRPGDVLASLTPAEFERLYQHAPARLRRFVDWATETSTHPQPLLALAAGTAWYGMLAGQRFRLLSGPDSRSNVYLLGVANSGGGKEAARACIKALASRMGLLECIGEGFRSDIGVHNKVYEQNTCLYLIDEFGQFYAGVSNSKGTNVFYARIASMLVRLWSSATGVFMEEEKGSTSLPDNARKDIFQPCLSVYGSTSPGQLWDALKSGDFSNGTLPRFLLFDQSNCIPERNFYPKEKNERIAEFEADSWEVATRGKREPNELLKATTRTETIAPPLQEADLGGGFVRGVKPDPVLTDVLYEPDALAYDHDVARASDNTLRIFLKNSAAGAVVARQYEYFRRLVLIAAVADNPAAPVARIEHVRWADLVTRWCIGTMLMAVDRYVADTQEESRVKRILTIARELAAASEDGSFKHSEISAQTMSMSKRDRDDTIKSLVEAGILMSETRKIEGKAGRPAAVYRFGGN